jgi:hypothetical protein
VAGSCEHGDEHSCSGATELVMIITDAEFEVSQND